MRPSSRLDNPAAYCGELIPSNAPTWKKTWWAEGEIKDRFYNKIITDINLLLRNADSGSAPFLWGVYMRGRDEKSASPYVLVSSHDKDTRKALYDLLENSHIPKTYPEFGIYKKPMQPYELRPSVSMYGEADATITSEDNDSDNDSSSCYDIPMSMCTDAILSSHCDPFMGRKLFISTIGDRPARSATGGVVFRLRDGWYQKTVGHIEDHGYGTAQNRPGEDFKYTYDEDSDDDDDDDDYLLQLDCNVTSRGSRTATDKSISAAASRHEDSETDSSYEAARPSNQDDDRHTTVNSISDQALIKSPFATADLDNSLECPPKLGYIGSLQHNCRSGTAPSLDYALVAIDVPFDTDKINRIWVNTVTETYIKCRGVGTVPDVKRDIVTVTASGGFTRGKLMPHAVYCHDHPKQAALQRLFIVQLDTVVVDGDCGADVVDEETGLLYGHIVRGGRGTQIAYIVPAEEVSKHILNTFNEVASTDILRKGQSMLGKRKAMADIETVNDQPSSKRIDQNSPAPISSGDHGDNRDRVAEPEDIDRVAKPEDTDRVAEPKDTDRVAEPKGTDGHGGESGGNKRAKRAIEVKLFACPFYQYDPTMACCSRACMGPGWPSLHRLKEHLNRVHRLPKYACPRCCDPMDDQSKLNDHLRSDKPCEKREVTRMQGINDAQYKKLRERRKTTGTLTEEQKWLDIYMILFPEANRKALPSPYYSRSDLGNSAKSAAQWKKMRKHIEEKLPSAVRTRVEERFAGAQLEVLHDLGDIIRDEVFQIFRGFPQAVSAPGTPDTLVESYEPDLGGLAPHFLNSYDPSDFFSNLPDYLNQPQGQAGERASDSGYAPGS
ncbi:hypothetical protein E8E14_003613 [Neopestalotiopsis sp. 37M]|nr:hypothetical protein E8E14_003613 [Neopestalotiopsis sp. 37M]